MGPRESIEDAMGKADQLIAIFVTSVATGRRNAKTKDT